jgi:hypothetical protein
MQPRTIRFAVLLVLNQSFVHRRRRVSTSGDSTRLSGHSPYVVFAGVQQVCASFNSWPELLNRVGRLQLE